MEPLTEGLLVSIFGEDIELHHYRTFYGVPQGGYFSIHSLHLVSSAGWDTHVSIFVVHVWDYLYK
jgi:hypothetical protein